MVRRKTTSRSHSRNHSVQYLFSTDSMIIAARDVSTDIFLSMAILNIIARFQTARRAALWRQFGRSKPRIVL